MTAWRVDGVELPFGTEPRTWWIDESGVRHDDPIDGAEELPGRFMLPGLADAHAHPAVTGGPSGPLPLGIDDARRNLTAWAAAGIAVVRDTGSPGGISLAVELGPGMPAMQAAGRFLAPAGRYFPQLLVAPVGQDELVTCALAEIARGATWVKVIADFPDLEAGSRQSERTYDLAAIAELAAAVHAAGARVAAHCQLPDASGLVGAGIDSVEHGTWLDEAAVREMAGRGTAWTPTLGATLSVPPEDLPPERVRRREEIRDRLAELLPLAARLGVPIMAGTDVVGSLPREVRLLAELGLTPQEALAAASVWPRQFLGAASTDIVTYDHDPRDDADQLANPAAVVIGGTRLR